MKLYEINAEIERLLESAVDPETGELTGSVEGLDQLEMDLKTKVLDTACYIKGTEAEAEAIREEEKKLAARRKTLERRTEWLREYLTQNMTAGEKLKDNRVSLSWRSSVSVDVLDEEVIPENFWRIKREVDKTSIRDALKAGTMVRGAQLIEKLNLQIR